MPTERKEEKKGFRLGSQFPTLRQPVGDCWYICGESLQQGRSIHVRYHHCGGFERIPIRRGSILNVNARACLDDLIPQSQSPVLWVRPEYCLFLRCIA